MGEPRVSTAFTFSASFKIDYDSIAEYVIINCEIALPSLGKAASPVASVYTHFVVCNATLVFCNTGYFHGLQ